MYEDDTIYLFPVPESEICEQPRGRTPAEQKILLEKGEVLTSKASIALLYHGTLTPGGEEATLVIVDFQFLKDKNKVRFRNAKMRVFFRDLDGDVGSCPIIHDLAPKSTFAIKPGVDVWKITRTGKLGLSGGHPGGGERQCGCGVPGGSEFHLASLLEPMELFRNTYRHRAAPMQFCD